MIILHKVGKNEREIGCDEWSSTSTAHNSTAEQSTSLHSTAYETRIASDHKETLKIFLFPLMRIKKNKKIKKKEE
ncbi:hypothetical protein POVWA2_010890 [Plasmodium ovale wallikeri]|uniref:Uncharacterized protein n=1 Tax=Plasmodium ovale wallikeri TaxID=864142 RepID=A0A1A8YLB3_PLAOA|nr:hypothetical protein POVWA1_010720 [Plasmodium ovale wallikeri]SBT32676.1 hypothetical protein POVWA2_010890 [Plasmodium ovale wallikeri]